MAGRKLNRRQRWRIEKIQQERAERARRKADRIGSAVAGDDAANGPERHGLLVANYGATAEVVAETGERHLCSVRQNLGRLVVGDRVVWQPADVAGGVITACEARRSLLSAPDRSGDLRPVAANIDRILIVLAPLPQYSTLLLDRLLIAAELTGIKPLILFNKCDLDIDVPAGSETDLPSLTAHYEAIGYQVHPTSIHRPESLAPLTTTLQQRTSVLVGQSGVGKSSLINRLAPGGDAATGPLSQRSGLGRHTTSTSQLHHLPDGGAIIDSPGVRDFALHPCSDHQLLDGMPEFRPLIGRCRFRNCLHLQEPGCVLQAAVAAGQVSHARLHHFQQIAAEMRSVR